MRILYIHSYRLDDQMANCVQVISMCKSFCKNHQVYLLTPISNKSESEIRKYLEINYNFPKSINLLFFESKAYGRRINMFLNYFSLRKYVKHVNPDFCFVRNTSFLYSLINLKIPVFYEVHNSVLQYSFKFLNYLLVKRLIILSKNSHLIKIITISEQLANFWNSEGIPRSKILILHDGFDSESFKNEINKSTARKLLGLNAKEKMVVYTGSLYKDRKIENIINLARDFRELKFYVIGGPRNEQETYIKYCNKNKISNIIFKGHIPHNKVSLYLYSADILLALWSNDVPTINFCSPLKLFEYMASGRLIIAHAYPPIKEVLINNYNAILVKPDKYNDLKSVFTKTLNSKTNEDIAKQARIDAFNKFSWDIRVSQIIKSVDKIDK